MRSSVLALVLTTCLAACGKPAAPTPDVAPTAAPGTPTSAPPDAGPSEAPPDAASATVTAATEASDAGPSGEPKPVEPAARGPIVRLADGELETEGFPAISEDGLVIVDLGGQSDEREGPVTTEVVIWHTLTDEEERHLLASRPGLDGGEPSAEDAKQEAERRKKAVEEVGARLAETKWRPLAAVEGLEATFADGHLVVKIGAEELLREPHPEWVVDDRPPCSEGDEPGEEGCGCSFPVEIQGALLDEARRVALVQVSYPNTHHCEGIHPGAFAHVARLPASGRSPDPTTARWTVYESVSLLCRDPSVKLPDDVVAARRAFIARALRTPGGLAAVWDAMAACGQPGAPVAPPADATWEEALQMSKWGVGISDDGKTVVLGTVDCDRAERWIETIVTGAPDHAAKKKPTTREKAGKIAAPLASIAGVRLGLGSSEAGEDSVTWHRVGALSLLATSRCVLPPDKRPKEGEEAMALDFVCTLRVHARPAAGGPGGVLAEVVEEFFWDPRAAEVFAREGSDTLVLALVKGGDHGCGTFDLASWSGPVDVAATINTSAVKALKDGRLADARRGFEAALALDPGATLARYNLACAHALQGDAAASAAALGPLVATDAKERAQWIQRVKKDRDFDRVRASAELAALLAK
ncbi:MAG: hypothetical protein IT385_30595 [Deltaproteobacteria bacterium]|nr:hypothetical protein [Deltaproteobacteria bacterium]